MPARSQLPAELPGLEDANRLNELIFILTTRCTQRCTFCCEPPGDPDMPTAKAVSWLQQAREAGIPWVDFSGGEPLLHSEVETLCRSAHHLGLRATLSTNGSTLTEHIDRLFPYVEQWNMSVHGLRAVHDRVVRRKGSWNAVIGGCRALSQLGATVHITYVVTSENIGDVAKVFEVLHEAGVKKLCFNYVFRRGRGNDYLQNHSISQAGAVRVVRRTLAGLTVQRMTVYHNCNLDGQCVLVRWNGDLWAVPMSNGQDFERIARMDRLAELSKLYPYLWNHKTFTYPRLAPVQDSAAEFAMTPSVTKRLA